MEIKQKSSVQVPRELPAMFRPPVNRAMRTLDRSFFRKTIPLATAKVFQKSEIARVRKELGASKDLLVIPRLSGVQDFKEADGSVLKSLLLREDLMHNDKSTWSPKVTELVEKGTVAVAPYELTLDYDFWSYADIMNAILPEQENQEVPQGFTQVGHVVHLNLREHWLPFKHFIAEVLKDKNPTVRTVINKTEDVGSTSQFRTFPFELLAGDNDLNVVQHEQDCEFHFDYSRVYWNSRLETEHRRLVEKFQPGQMVCDVMAGVGPFAVPAGKKRIFVWANDLNPHGYEVMMDAVQRNKVKDFVTPFNSDGRDFIRNSATQLLESDPVAVEIHPKVRRDRKRKADGSQDPQPPAKVYNRPSVVDHYVMNLPATAIEFLDAFQGLYTGKEAHFAPQTSQQLPMVHVYCFSGHSENEVDDHANICERISERIGYKITPEDRVDGSGNAAIELNIHNVRLVSPKKQMFCASFRLPPDVAFRKV
ncbi:tRNA (guanine(37)-N1)-methyltransferase [Penicillium argentinense]|uniref:tRNA (guanine(37)-N1)-methyltransferase n=1 Tax=Penicillium argentinense TaxID=1131581 RepID=A0A9W9KMA1_9EURO|nr:tRNA (guanine(37)-N1)-methyltransferase [Penicillium argentinense]KAJ5111420.1 tRNA (guanine(37)-N1)-methyltransferase [Penicillium argentinense]